MSELKKLDFIGGVLYGSVPEEVIQKHIWGSAQRLDTLSHNDRKIAQKIAEQAQQGPRIVKVCAFFALLNYDDVMKDQFRDLGQKRASNFYMDLRENMDQWLKNDLCSNMEMFEMLRTVYRNA